MFRSFRASVLLCVGLLGCPPTPPPPGPREPPASAPAEGALSPEETQALLSLLPPLDAPAPASQSTLSIPVQETLLPQVARQGESLGPMSLPASVPSVAPGPLLIERYSPIGESRATDELSLHFSQPMIPLASIGATLSQVPATLSPQVEGEWRWISTDLLKFVSPAGLPMATTFTVEVPAGTRSALGGTLAAPLRYSFATPPLTLARSIPASGQEKQPLQPVIWLFFDQRVEPEDLLPHLALYQDLAPPKKIAKGGEDAAAARRTVGVSSSSTKPRKEPPAPTVPAKAKRHALRLATQDEQDSESPSHWLSTAPAGTWVAVRPESPLPAEGRFVVLVDAEAPSAEGPRRNKAAQGFQFETIAPFKVLSATCGDGKLCSPYRAWQFTFSQGLADDVLEAGRVAEVSPEVENLRASVYYDTLSLSGNFAPNTTYTVTIKAGLRSEFGESLATEYRVTQTVGDPEPSLEGYLYGNFGSLYPAEAPFYSYQSGQLSGVKVRAYQVEARDYGAFLDYLRGGSLEKPRTTVPGKLVLSGTYKDSDFGPTEVELGSVLPGGHGQLILVAEPVGALSKAQRSALTNTVWVQFTTLAASVYEEPGQLRVWVTELASGAPVADAEVQLLPGGGSARTDADGLVVLPLGRGEEYLLQVTARGETMIHPRAVYPAGREAATAWENQGWRASPVARDLSWFLASDRKLYRAGEEAAFVGFVRIVDPTAKGGLGLPGKELRSLSCTLVDRSGRELGRAAPSVSALGSFSFRVRLPQEAAPGLVSATCKAVGAFETLETSAVIDIREFRRPEFETLVSVGEGPFFVGDKVQARLSASYYNGGPLADAPTTWDNSSWRSSFVPEGWGGFAFGRRAENWVSIKAGVSSGGKTDAAGTATHTVTLSDSYGKSPYTLELRGAVRDVNRQQWAGSASLLVHPAALYVGLRPTEVFAARGKPLPLEVIVVNLDGEPVAGRSVSLVAERVEEVIDRDGEAHANILESLSCTVVSGAVPASCVVTPSLVGRYQLRASVVDDAGREAQSESSFSAWELHDNEREETRDLRLSLDKSEYQPGETARLTIATPVFPAEAVLYLVRGGVEEARRLRLNEATTTIALPLTEAMLPNLGLMVELVARQDPTATDPEFQLPEVYQAHTTVLFSLRSQRLSLAITPRETTLRPGGKTSIDAVARRADGSPVVGGEVTLMVVDEAVLDLAGKYRVKAPLDEFYPERSAWLSSQLSRYDTSLLRRGTMWGRGFGGGGSGFGAGGGVAGGVPGGAPPAVRGDFSPLALFVSGLTTDAQGRVSVPLTLPGNLTRYRVMGLVVEGAGRFGDGEAVITARQDLMVRPSPPRFLRVGDAFSLPVVVQNQSAAPMRVEVAARALGISLLGPGQRVTVPAGGRVEVRFAGESALPGPVRLQVIARASGVSDAAQLGLQVVTPVTTETVAVYGTLADEPIAQPIVSPREALPGFGGLTLNLSSSALLGLSDAAISLHSYPYGCAEQLSSKVIGIASIWDTLQTLGVQNLPPEEELREVLQVAVRRLAGRQSQDGAVGLWVEGQTIYPFVSVHVAHAFYRAQQLGIALPSGALSRSQDQLRALSSASSLRERDKKSPLTEEDAVVASYALYVRALLGDGDNEAQAWLWREFGERLPLEAVSFLLMIEGTEATLTAAREAGAARLLATVSEAAGVAQFRGEPRRESGYLVFSSEGRLASLGLAALLVADPANGLVPKLAAGLLARRQGARWWTTQENAFSLLAMRRYAEVAEAVEPDSRVRVWLGDKGVGEASFRGRALTPQRFSVGLDELTADSVTLAREGTGRVYYRLGLSYALREAGSASLDRGFSVTRVYEGVDDPGSVRQEADGAWHIRAGSRVRVRVTVAAPARRYHAAVVDHLPAGLEAVDPGLSGSFAERGGYGSWFEHRAFRDDRVEAFSSVLSGGVHRLEYTANATTPGRFIAPPPRAEEMYAPETFGRGAGEVVVIE